MSFGGFGKDSGPTIPPRAQAPFGNFTRPPSPSPPAPSFPGSSAPPLSGSPGSFGANERARSPLPIDNALQSKGPRMSSTSSRAASLQWVNDQNLPIGGFGGPMQNRSPPYGPRDTVTSISSKVSYSQDVERTRTPVQYTEDFLADPTNAGVEGPSLSPPKSRRGTSVLGMPDFQHTPRLSSSVDGTNDDISVKKFVSHSVPKRNRSPPAAGAGQISQASFFSTEDDAERELQAKARRLARFKTELDEVKPGDSLQYGLDFAKKEISSVKADQSAIEKPKFSRDFSGSMEEISQDNDNEDLQACGVIVGLCPDMCPESERAERERKGDLDQYERVDGDRNQTSKALAVKKYNRTAEREAELIRPMSMLWKTMDYLLGLLDQPYDDRFLGLYNFLWDRMRAIRMDLRMQHIFNLEAIAMLEQMIRLHIIAMHELCEFSKGEGFSEGFDAHLNIEQMNKTSVELFQLYDDHRKRGIFIPTEKEFRGYYALLKLDKHPGYKVEPAELSLDLAKMTAEIRQTHEVLFARDVARSCRTGNFIAFFRHARRASYLQACLMHAHFSKLRTQALASLHSGLQYNQGLPVAHAAKWLGMEGEDLKSLLEYHGFAIKEFEEPYMVKEGPFLNAEKDYPTQCSILVHGKKSNKIAEDIISSRSHQAPVVPSESKKELQLDKNDRDRHAVVQPIKTNSSIVVSGAMEIDTVSSPRNDRQVKEHLGASRIGQAYMENNHSTSLLSSPKSNIRIPKVFSNFQGNSLQELPSPVTPKDSSVIVDDRELSSKSPLWNISTPQFVPDNCPTYVEQPRDPFYGGLVSLPENSSKIAVHSELRATEPDIISANANEFIPSACEADSGNASSLHEDILMEEGTRKEVTDAQQNFEDNDVSCYDQEVAEAKLKLFIRLWRRHSARKKELREQNRIAANAALSSLSLGPPVHHSKDKPTPFRKLNIDQAVSERREKCQQSWARWNISELVAVKLGEKNAEFNCICWKVVLFSWLHWDHVDSGGRNPVTDISLDQWLQYKLIPSQKDETSNDLVTSAPGMAIWRKWVCNDFGCDTCCLSVIKDAESGNFEKNLLGTSAILFAVSEIVPWEHQRVQLHNLVMSLPAGAGVPLLIISGSMEDNVAELSCRIVDKLGLKDIDNSRVGTFLVKCVNERDDTGQFDGYFSDQKLKEGFMWLASETLPQPVLSCVTMRELVFSHLNMCLDALDPMDSDKLNPNSYISIFNKALERSMNDIVTAASMNPTGWPCPELYLLDNLTSEFRAVRRFLPSLGWNSTEEVEPLISTLRNLKLPSFSDDLVWLSRDCSTGKDIEDQRQLLQDCLIRYLTQSSNVMNLMMATKEAVVMLQQCTRLELLNTAVYKVVPSWLLIFRRVFSWQLNTLGSITRKAYVLEQSHSTSLEKSEFEASGPHYIAYPSMDEMVEVSCSPIVSRIARSLPKSINVSEVTSISDTSVSTMLNFSADKGSQCPMVQVEPVNSNVNLERNDLPLAPYTEKEADRLSKLLDRCNILQGEIEKKLSIYF